MKILNKGCGLTFLKNLMYVIGSDLKKRKVIFCMLLTVISIILQPYIIKILGESINLINIDNMKAVYYVICYLLGFIITTVINYYTDMEIVHFTSNTEKSLRLSFLDSISNSDWRYYASQKQGELNYRCYDQINELSKDSWLTITLIIDIIISVISITVYTTLINSWFLLVFLIIVPICSWLSLRSADICLKTAEIRQTNNEIYNGVLNETISNIDEIKIFGTQRFFRDRLFHSIDNATIGENKHQKSIIIYRMHEKVYNLISYIIIFILAVYFVYIGKMEIGYIIVLLNYGNSIFLKTTEINYLKDIYYNNKTILEEFNLVLNCPKIYDGKLKNIRSDSDNILELQNVEIQYNDSTKILYNLSVKPGEHIAINGNSGCGKTTLFRILVKLISSTSGVPRVFGNDINKFDATYLRQHICYVPQNPYTFNGTILENIIWGNENVNKQDVIEFLRDFNLINMAFDKEGHPKYIIEMGKNLSGGEQQRIVLIRALLRESDIYLFDESFSQIDYSTEIKMLNLIKSKLGKKTLIFISHKNTIKNYVNRVIEL